jgi:hypothetical protein
MSRKFGVTPIKNSGCAAEPAELDLFRVSLGLKSFWSARIITAGIETMHMIRKGQLKCPGGQIISAADQFYTLAV